MIQNSIFFRSIQRPANLLTEEIAGDWHSIWIFFDDFWENRDCLSPEKFPVRIPENSSAISEERIAVYSLTRDHEAERHVKGC